MTQEINVKDYTKFILNHHNIRHDKYNIDELMFSYGCIYEEDEEDDEE
jgi:hypothetical protein